MAASPTSRSSQTTLHSKVAFNLIPHTATKMSVTQTFYLAHKARGKLSSEASRSDHNLRMLVGLSSPNSRAFVIGLELTQAFAGHANLLDSLMIHLAEAEAEQERWYQNTVRGNERDWAETEDAEGYGSLAADYDSESESDEEYDDDDEEEEEEEEINTRPRYTLNSGPMIAVQEVEEEDYDEDYDEEDYDEEGKDGMFALTRTTSHRPPSLCSDESDDDEEEAHPPSPTQSAEPYPLSRKDLHEVSYFDAPHGSLLHEPSEVIFEDRLLPTMVSSY
jgi:hypothetical protein